MNDVAHVLLGAALAAIGVVATAVADRIRGGARRGGNVAPDARPPSIALPQPMVRVPVPTSAKPRGVRASVPRTSPSLSPSDTISGRSFPAEVKRHSAIADEVIAALVASGHRRPIATAAVWACNQDARGTVESWTFAALRHCAQGVTS
jgi:hypothetical protein